MGEASRGDWQLELEDPELVALNERPCVKSPSEKVCSGAPQGDVATICHGFRAGIADWRVELKMA